MNRTGAAVPRDAAGLGPPPRGAAPVRFPRVRVSGSARQRGVRYGEQCRDRIGRSLAAYERVFAEYAGMSWSAARRVAKPFQDPIGAFSGAILEELEGIAAGAGSDFEDILTLNVRSELMFAAKAREAGRSAPRGGCSALAVLPSRSVDGHTLLGQNWDWLLHARDTVVILEVERAEGPDYVTVVEAGLLAKTGMNSSGIGVVTNTLISTNDRAHPGLPYHVLLRALLDSETISDALATLQSGPRSSSANYLLAHADGLSVDVEAQPGDQATIALVWPDRGLALHTNHCVAAPMQANDLSVWAIPDSPFRLERLRQALGSSGDRLSLASCATALADHGNFPASVCYHPDPRLPAPRREETVASVLMDLDARRMLIADGTPCTTPYQDVDYSAFLGKPSVLRSGKGPTAA